MFPNRKYVECDIREGRGVDKILDLHDTRLPPEDIGTVLILDAVEYVEFPCRAIEEVYRIQIPEGMVVISSVMDYRIHGSPDDYWRFTPDGSEAGCSPFLGISLAMPVRKHSLTPWLGLDSRMILLISNILWFVIKDGSVSGAVPLKEVAG